MQTVEVGTRLALKRILFPTDFSQCAQLALPYAVALALHYGSKVIVAHVLPPEPWPVIPHDAMPLAMDRSYSYGERAMADLLKSNPFPDVPYEVVLEKGELWPAFEYIIQKHGIDMIVMATHGRHGIRKFLLGSAAEEIFRRATCPVLTVGPKLTPHPRHESELACILFATDFSSGSLHALPYAFSLAEENQARLILLHVLQDGPSIVLEAQTSEPDLDRIEARAKLELQKLVPPEEPYLWSNSEFLVQWGMPAEVMLKLAEERKVDLIVMGVRGAESAAAATRLPWATAHKVVAQSPCPVLTVRG
jgi:nucleotide-binding universal stress UspA family protein